LSANQRRPSGGPPYWSTGTQVMWRYGDGPLGTGAAITDTTVAHFAEPVTVVRDDADGLVAWLAAGTPVLCAGRADGLGKRADKSTLFTAETVQEIGEWTDYDVLRIAPTARPWSVCVFFAEHTGDFAGWYVNLEDPHIRDDHAVYTSDHVLDLLIAPDRSLSRKDEDELELAVAQGLYDAATAAAIEADAAEVEAIVADWGAPFCDGWEHYRPDPAWPVPRLPEGC
jgi:predicted RNA-binding protein associated with RNAse of E/G family